MQNTPLPGDDHVPVEAVEDDPGRPWKAIVGFLGPIVAALFFALMPFSDAGTVITDNEWGTILAASGLTGVGVFVAKNPKRVKK